ncbi:MAG: hypothetical protein Q9195_000810 [Heterodermia aff. obscurata]
MENDNTTQLSTTEEPPHTKEKMSESEVKSLVTPPATAQKTAINKELCLLRARWVKSLNADIAYWLTLPSTAVNFYVFLNLAQISVTVAEAAKLLRLGGIFITRIFYNGAMPLSESISRILSHLEYVGEAENFAVLLRGNGFPKVGWKDASGLMAQLARFLPRLRALERVPDEVGKEGETSSKGKEKSTSEDVFS